MTAEQRKQRAIEHLQEKIDEAREIAEYDEQEQMQQALDDRAETARQSGVHPMMRSKSPGVLRAEESARQWFSEHRPEQTDQQQLAASPFGGGDDDGGRDDEDDLYDG